jgi:hypothetical protein
MKIFIIYYIGPDNRKNQLSVSATHEEEAKTNFQNHMNKFKESYKFLELEEAEVESEEI